MGIERVENKDAVKERIREFLVTYDDEFVPSLSNRTGTNDHFTSKSENESISKYLETLMDQELLVCKKDGNIVGFLSYDIVKENEQISQFVPCVYISTTIIEKEYRKEGIATALNEYLYDNLDVNGDISYITRRTWSTNKTSMNYIESMAFEEIERIENDRGNGIDTIYYARELSVIDE